MLDLSGMILSLSGIILGVLLAVAEYHVELWPALSLILTAALLAMIPMIIIFLIAQKQIINGMVEGAIK